MCKFKAVHVLGILDPGGSLYAAIGRTNCFLKLEHSKRDRNSQTLLINVIISTQVGGIFVLGSVFFAMLDVGDWLLMMYTWN